MGQLGRWLGLSATAAVLAAGGCAFDRKPYADDPLLRRGRGVWGDTTLVRSAGQAPAVEPVVPVPPAGPLLGSPLYAKGNAGPLTSK